MADSGNHSIKIVPTAVTPLLLKTKAILQRMACFYEFQKNMYSPNCEFFS
jgi:hypothetical protein